MGRDKEMWKEKEMGSAREMGTEMERGDGDRGISVQFEAQIRQNRLLTHRT